MTVVGLGGVATSVANAKLIAAASIADVRWAVRPAVNAAMRQSASSPERSNRNRVLRSRNKKMALADPNGDAVLEAQGICRGEILTAPDGHGAGYDPIFWVREAGMTYARMGQHLKNKLGSRGKAARNLAPDLKRLLGIG